METNNTVCAVAHPSLALIKYWGKINTLLSNVSYNISATTSIAVTLDNLSSRVRIAEAPENQFYLDGELQNFNIIQLFQHVFQKLYKRKFKRDLSIQPIIVDAKNDFPTASGLASSSSGYAALVKALDAFYGVHLRDKELSSLARIGSGSASRSIYGGFTIWERGKGYAKEIPYDTYWDQLSVIILAPYMEKKSFPSRDAMIQTAHTSPYYISWVQYSKKLSRSALRAIENKDIEELGILIRKSYTAMHASSIAAYPSIRYWKPKSIEILDYIDEMRMQGIAVWETMDAGPQVKLITTEAYVDKILHCIGARFPNMWTRVCGLGQGAKIE